MRDWLSLHWFNRVSLLTCLLCKVTSQYTGNGFGSICGCWWNSLWSSQSSLEVKNKNKPHICLTMYARFHCCYVQFGDEQSLAVGKKKHEQAFTTIPQTLGKPTYKPSWNSSLTPWTGLEQPVQRREVSSQSQNKAVVPAGWQSSSTSLMCPSVRPDTPTQPSGLSAMQSGIFDQCQAINIRSTGAKRRNKKNTSSLSLLHLILAQCRPLLFSLWLMCNQFLIGWELQGEAPATCWSD